MAAYLQKIAGVALGVMPIYEYECPVCGEKFELRRGTTDSDSEIKCPKCGGGRIHAGFYPGSVLVPQVVLVLRVVPPEALADEAVCPFGSVNSVRREI